MSQTGEPVGAVPRLPCDEDEEGQRTEASTRQGSSQEENAVTLHEDVAQPDGERAEAALFIIQLYERHKEKRDCQEYSRLYGGGQISGVAPRGNYRRRYVVSVYP